MTWIAVEVSARRGAPACTHTDAPGSLEAYVPKVGGEASGSNVMRGLRDSIDSFLKVLNDKRDLAQSLSDKARQLDVGSRGVPASLRLSSLDERRELCAECVCDRYSGHESSPSVGAQKCAVCDNPNPTDGELNPGAATSPNSAAPAPTQTEVQE